jgi:hypothetical protein
VSRDPLTAPAAAPVATWSETITTAPPLSPFERSPPERRKRPKGAARRPLSGWFSIRLSTMREDVSQHADLTNRLKEATVLRRNAEWNWRDAIAAARAAGVSVRTIGEVAGISDVEIQEILRDVEDEGGT